MVCRIRVGLFGHILGVSWEEGCVAKSYKNIVYPIGVGLFGHILGMSCEAGFSPIHAKIRCILLVWISLDISWEPLARQVHHEKIVHPIGVGLFGHILGVSWVAGFVDKLCKK